ncbi:hypothetical protein BDK51DRAFT_32037, partial [Blyttiomyces helicus]
EKLSLSENETWMRNYDSDLQKATDEGDQFTARLETEDGKLEEIRKSLEGKTEVFQKQIEAKQQELEPWAEKINAAQAAIDVAQSEHDLLKSTLSAADDALAAARARIIELRAMHKQKETELQSVQETQRRHAKKLLDAKRQLEVAVKEEEELKVSFNAARQKADEARASLQSAQTRGKLHESIMQQSQRGRINGICGRLGDLGVIDSKYDVAITTACGALESIVVDTVEAGQACIEHLKRAELGRATFICLDKLKPRDPTPLQAPESVPRLFDLVKPADPKYAVAFHQVLGDTLVANDLAQANRIAFGSAKGARRYRVVTLEGQLIDASGTMSGGGARPSSGGMNSKFAADPDASPDKVRDLERGLDQIQLRLREAEARRKRLEREFAELEGAGPRFEVELSKLGMDLESVAKDVVDAERHADDVKKQHKEPSTEDLHRIDTLSSTIATHTKSLLSLRQSSSQIESAITALQNRILEVGGVKLRTQAAIVDGIREQIDAVQARITRMQVERSTRVKAGERLVKAIKKKEEEVAEIEAELKALREGVEENARAVVDVKARVRDAKKILETKEAEIQKLKEEHDAKNDLVNEMRESEVAVKNDLEKAQASLNDFKRQLNFYSQAIAKLALQTSGFEEEELAPLQTYTAEELAEMDIDSVESEIAALEETLKKETPNLTVLAEYKAKLDIYRLRADDLAEIVQRRDEVRRQHDDLLKERLDRFMEGFVAISQKLKEMYQMITMGGNAELELVDSLDPFSEGIVFSVMPPKKSWKNISNLSGGEK